MNSKIIRHAPILGAFVGAILAPASASAQDAQSDRLQRQLDALQNQVQSLQKQVAEAAGTLGGGAVSTSDNVFLTSLRYYPF